MVVPDCDWHKHPTEKELHSTGFLCQQRRLLQAVLKSVQHGPRARIGQPGARRVREDPGN